MPADDDDAFDYEGALAAEDQEQEAAAQQQEPPLPRAPWSAVGPSFIQQWGYPGGRFDPEHLEILGPSGSGKTYAEATVLQSRVKMRNSAVIFIATKPVDKTIMLLGWPVVDTWKAVVKPENRQCIYWPRTNLMGDEWEAYMAAKISDLLSRLWRAKAKVILVFDEIATSEDFSPRLKKIIKRYWREARSVGITIVAMKQRPQGIQRDMHSEAAWILAFKPKDEEDGFRVAQIMGSHKLWLPRLMALDRESHEFIALHSVTGEAVITWIDIPLKPAVREKRGLYRKAT